MTAADAPAAATPAAHATVTLAVSGMTCAACVGRLERVLGKRPGVAGASVSLPAERAEIVFDPDRISLAELVAAVEDAGFGARPLEEGGAHSEADAREVRGVLTTLAVSALLSLPLLVEMALGLLDAPVRVPGWVQALLATPVQFWAGARFYRGAWAALRTGGANMDVLVTLGTSAAYLLSLWLLLTGAGHHGHLYFEAAALVITLVLAGKALEARARRATNRAIEALLALRPESARRIDAEGREELVPLAQVRAGDRIRVRPGERIAADGTVLEGRAAVDEAMITGEPLPRERGPGAAVTGGTLNLDGLLTVAVTAVGAQAVLGRMIALVGHAQATKPRIQHLADTVSGWFAFFVAGVAALTFLGWFFGVGAGLEGSILPAVTVLVVACPCALGLATPAVIAVALGAAARHGILIRDAEALEAAHGLGVVVFDKTGTLTEDRPELAALVALSGDDTTLLARAASVQRGSAHPIARAFADRARESGLALRTVSDFRAVAGRGVIGTVDGLALALGNAGLMTELAVDCTPLAATAAGWEAEGKAVLWLAEAAVPPRLLGVAALADRIRPGAIEAVAALARLGVETLMLTGDAAAAARATAGRLGMTQVLAGVRPEDKIAEIERRQGLGQRVAMVGDGVNDGPALARADLGIAMGGGTDVAIQAAGVSLMRADPGLVPATVELARATRAKIVQNLVWAFGFNLIMIPLAATASFGPVAAAAGMTLSSLTVVGNALLLQGWRPAAARAATERR